MVSSKKANLYDRITQERINQNWNRVEKLCKDQETKHVLKHTAAKNLQLKEHRHLFFKLLQAEANFEIFLRRYYNFDSDLNSLVKTLVPLRDNDNNNSKKETVTESGWSSTVCQNLVLNSNLSKILNEKQENNTSQFPFPSAGKHLSKLKPHKSKSRDRLERQNSDNTLENVTDDNKSNRDRHESAKSVKNFESQDNNHPREKSSDRNRSQLTDSGQKEELNEKYDLEYFINKFKDLRKDFRKLPRDKKIELVQKFNCYGYIEASVHLARCYFFSGKLNECKKMLIEEMLVDKYDPRSEKIKRLNSVFSNGVSPSNDISVSETRKNSSNNNKNYNEAEVLVNDHSYSSDMSHVEWNWGLELSFKLRKYNLSWN